MAQPRCGTAAIDADMKLYLGRGWIDPAVRAMGRARPSAHPVASSRLICAKTSPSQSKDRQRAPWDPNRIRAGRSYLDGAPFDRRLPSGGYKQSGHGRELGVFGFEEYLEVKAVPG
jgi:hypothetical protein